MTFHGRAVSFREGKVGGVFSWPIPREYLSHRRKKKIVSPQVGSHGVPVFGCHFQGGWKCCERLWEENIPDQIGRSSCRG